MSNEAITWAFNQDGLTMTEKFVLIALADYANEVHMCFPAHEKTAKRVAASRSTVKRAVRSLEQKGLLRVVSWHRPNGSDTSNRYQLRVGGQYEPPGQCEPGEGFTVDRGGGHSEPGARVTSEPPITPSSYPPVEPPGKNSSSPGGDGGRYSADFLDWWEHYPRKQDKGAAYRVFLKIRDTPLDVLIEGADRYAADPNREPRFTKHAATWLRARAWEDETPLPARNTKPTSRDRLAQIQALKGGDPWTEQTSLTS